MVQRDETQKSEQQEQPHSTDYGGGFSSRLIV